MPRGVKGSGAAPAPKAQGGGKPRGRPKEAPSADGPVTTDHNKAKNAESLSDADMHRLLAAHVGHYKGALEEKKRADADFKNVCKMIKADGIKLDDVKVWIEFDSETGEAKVTDRVQRTLRVAKWRGAKIGEQLGLFMGEEGKPDLGAAYRAGQRASREGKKEVPPSHYDIAEWLRGFRDDQDAMIASMGKSGTGEGAATH